uniref:Uncharacterized protein n=1 Tax=Romanomermis culicivorax TaxID=13658 RepID=A0A915JGQ1_ROMCU
MKLGINNYSGTIDPIPCVAKQFISVDGHTSPSYVLGVNLAQQKRSILLALRLLASMHIIAGYKMEFMESIGEKEIDKNCDNQKSLSAGTGIKPPAENAIILLKLYITRKIFRGSVKKLLPKNNPSIITLNKRTRMQPAMPNPIEDETPPSAQLTSETVA